MQNSELIRNVLTERIFARTRARQARPGVKLQDSGLRNQDSGLMTQDSGLMTRDSELRTQTRKVFYVRGFYVTCNVRDADQDGGAAACLMCL